MIVQAADMVKDVKVAIDMNRNDVPLLTEGDPETLTLDEIIYAKLTEGVRLVEMEAPSRLLESGHEIGEERMFVGDDGKGFIVLPEDFMRLVAFRMSDWKRTVFEAITEDDPLYALQSSKWKGVCGTVEKPVVAIVRRSEGKVLEFYSCRDGNATVTHGTYLPYPRIDKNGGIDVARDCYQAAVYRTAALTLASVGDQLSTTMIEISKSLLT